MKIVINVKDNKFLLDKSVVGSEKTFIRFLIDDVSMFHDDIVEWFFEPEKHYSAGEFFYEEQIGNNVIIYPDYYDGPSFTISKNNFLKVINKWHEIMQKKPKKITITQEGDDFFFDVEY
ncbi:hypothetical protein HN446_00030 [bacterium]|jgi:hypothetical protein|nr:hypothetical protein [bacterium]